MFKIEVPKNNIPMNFVDLGHQGEGNTSYVLFDLQHFIDELGEGTWEVVNLRPGEEMPYLVANTDELIDQETGIAKAMWILDETDMAIAGEGRVELRYYPTDGTAKTDVYRTRILPSLGVSSEDPPEPFEDILDQIAAQVQAAQTAADQAQGAVDEAVTELQAELDEAISGATVDSEVINARIGADATTYSTLKARLDAENTDLKNHLLQHQASIEDILLTKVLTDAQKNAILACFRNVAWINDQGQTYYEALQEAFDVSVTSISAVYTQSGTVYDTQTLDDLRQNLAVTATMSDGTTSAVAGYTLSGSLTAGTSTITVTYAEKTATFNVTVTHMQGSIVSISAVFDSSATITTDDSLEDLRQYLTVTAHYDSGDDVDVTGYTLSGSLNVGQNTITVTYSNKTTTFTVTVIEAPHITAVFDASGNTIYTDDALDSLKQYLIVTYHENGTQAVLDDNDYTLSGVLTEGTSTITVTYEGLRTNVSVIGVVDFYNIWNWSLSNGDFIKLAASTDRASDSLTGIYISLAETRPSVQYRRHCTVKRGKLPYTDYISHELSQYYPIPIPNGANKIKVSVTPSTQFTFINVVKYNSETNKYEYYADASSVSGWTQGVNEKAFTASENLFLFFNMKYDSAGTSYPTEPTDVVVTFEEV